MGFAFVLPLCLFGVRRRRQHFVFVFGFRGACKKLHFFGTDFRD